MDRERLTQRRRQHERNLARAIEDIVDALSRRPDVEQAILFGSYAEGRRDLFTDLDILIVMTSSLDFVTRTAEMYRYLSSPVDVDLLVYTPEEFERNRDRGFIREAMRHGKVIYEKSAA